MMRKLDLLLILSLFMTGLVVAQDPGPGDNYFIIDAASSGLTVGQTGTIKIRLVNNDNDTAGGRFDLTVPEGFTLNSATPMNSASGGNLTSLTDVSPEGDGSIMRVFLAGFPNLCIPQATNDIVVELSVTVDSSVAEGNYLFSTATQPIHEVGSCGAVGFWDVQSDPIPESPMVTVGTLSSIEYDIADFSMYPNPTKDILNIHFSNVFNDAVEVSIYSITGQLVLNTSIKPNNGLESSIDVSTLSQGSYILRLKSTQRTINKQLIIE